MNKAVMVHNHRSSELRLIKSCDICNRLPRNRARSCTVVSLTLRSAVKGEAETQTRGTILIH